MKKENIKNENIERLLNILKECKNIKGYDNKKRGVRLVFTDLKASASGMSRTFKIYVITKKGEMLNITYLISNIYGSYTNEGKLRVYGCGMDMLFETCYQINCFLHRYKGHKTYNHDKAYHGYVDTFYDLL